jgi:hypothetical protein
MDQPSCEDLRLGKTIEGFQLHSPLGQGPFFRIYGANKGPEEWRLYAWDKLPAPPKEALSRFESLSQALTALKDPSLIRVAGPFTFPDGAVGWAVHQPNAKDGASFVTDGARKSVAAPGLAAIARGLGAAAEAGVIHPGLTIESLWFSQKAPFGLVGGFFSWRRLYPELSQYLPPEEALDGQAPEGNVTAASLVYSLSCIAKELSLSSPEGALQKDPASRPSLSALADSYAAQAPGFFGRLFGR